MQLEKMRSQRGLSRTDIAQMVNVTLSTVTRWENGTRKPDVFCAIKLCEAMGCTLDELFRDDINPTPTPTPPRAGGEQRSGERFESGVEEASAFGEAAEAFFPIVSDHQSYRRLLMDIADNGRLDDPSSCQLAQNLICALEEAML